MHANKDMLAAVKKTGVPLEVLEELGDWVRAMMAREEAQAGHNEYAQQQVMEKAQARAGRDKYAQQQGQSSGSKPVQSSTKHEFMLLCCELLEALSGLEYMAGCDQSDEEKEMLISEMPEMADTRLVECLRAAGSWDGSRFTTEDWGLLAARVFQLPNQVKDDGATAEAIDRVELEDLFLNSLLGEQGAKGSPDHQEREVVDLTKSADNLPKQFGSGCLVAELIDERRVTEKLEGNCTC